MSLVGKIFAVLSLVIAVFYVGSTATLVSMQENYRKRLVNAEATHDTKEKAWADKKRSLTKSRDDAKASIADLRDRLGNTSAENINLRNDYLGAVNANAVAQKLIADQEATINRLDKSRDEIHRDLKDKRDENTRLTTKLGELNAELATRKTQIDTLIQDRDTAENNLMKAGKELEKLASDYALASSYLIKLKEWRPDMYDKLVRTTERLQPEKAIRGKVTAVDQKMGLVIVNRGTRHDVQKGITFIVFRGSKYIGKVKVDEVFPDVAASTYVGASMQGDIEVGDDVTTKLSVEDF